MEFVVFVLLGTLNYMVYLCAIVIKYSLLVQASIKLI